MVQTKAAQASNIRPAQSLIPSDLASAALQAGQSNLPLETLLGVGSKQLQRAGAAGVRSEKIAGAKEKTGITREAKSDQARARVAAIKQKTEQDIEAALGAGLIKTGVQLAQAELQSRREEEEQNKAALRKAAMKGKDSFFRFLDENPEIEFDPETLNEVFTAIPGVRKERELAKAAYQQTPVDFSRGEDYRKELARRVLLESPEVQAESALRQVLPVDQRAPAVFRPQVQLTPQDINAISLQDVMAARAASRPNLGALELAQSSNSILGNEGSLAVGRAASSLNLRPGAEGTEVLEVQKAIAAIPGFENIQLIPGVYDEATKDAVRAFQRSRNLDVDGVVGPSTFRELSLTLYELAERQELDALNQAALQRSVLQPFSQEAIDRILGAGPPSSLQSQLAQRILGGM